MINRQSFECSNLATAHTSADDRAYQSGAPEKRPPQDSGEGQEERLLLASHLHLLACKPNKGRSPAEQACALLNWRRQDRARTRAGMLGVQNRHARCHSKQSSFRGNSAWPAPGFVSPSNPSKPRATGSIVNANCSKNRDKRFEGRSNVLGSRSLSVALRSQCYRHGLAARPLK